MQRDLTGGDTTGIYYEILSQGTGADFDYPDRISFVYAIKSLDGKYNATDTISNHSYAYVGQLTPPGLMMAMRNIVKRKGTRAHILIPSRLAYGRNGSGTGSTRLPGNESLDYYIHVIDDQQKYDDISIRQYMTANNLSGYTKIDDVASPYYGLWYKVTKPGTGTDVVTDESNVTVQYTGLLLNGTMFEESNTQDGYTSMLGNLIKGWQGGLRKVTAGAQISLLIPSALAYGTATSGSIPPNSCLRFEINLLSVSNY